MSTARRPTSRRRSISRKTRPVPPPRPVQEMLLELAYRLHVTKPIAVVRREIGSIA